MPKDNAALLVALGGLKKKPGADEEMDEELPEDDGEMESMDPTDEAFEAMKAGDKEGFRDAFKRAVMACMGGEDEY